MISEEKLKEIKRRIKNGEPQGEIIEQLRTEGVTEDDIKKIFEPHKYDMRTWYLLFAIAFLIYGLYLLITQQIYLVLIFSGLMFYVYSLEVKRQKKVSEDRTSEK